MTKIKIAERPKWAKNIEVPIWRALHQCQGKKPTLPQLVRDVAHQKENGVKCWTCEMALRQVQQ